MTTRCRVFAAELAETTLTADTGLKNSQRVLVMPGGGCCSEVFIAGALTRIERPRGDFMQAWVMDTTGTFTLNSGRQDTDAWSFLEQAETPVFVTVSGEVQLVRGSREGARVHPVEIRQVDRTVRDSWTITTAALMISRLEELESAVRNGTDNPMISLAIRHYNITTDRVGELILIAREALSKVQPVGGGEIIPPDPMEIVIDLIRTKSGPKGISVAELLPFAARSGIRENEVIDTIRRLVEEDECYQPSAGFVKLL